MFLVNEFLLTQEAQRIEGNERKINDPIQHTFNSDSTPSNSGLIRVDNVGFFQYSRKFGM